MTTRLERALSVTLTTAAVIIALAVVRRELLPSLQLGRTAGRADPPIRDTRWGEMLQVGIELGAANAAVKIVEFTDLQCPACRFYRRSVLAEMKSTFGDKVSEIIVHYPLKAHPLARVAAVAAECAAHQGAFSGFVEAAFAKQDSLGLKTWGSYAKEAGVADSMRFNQCMKSPPPMPRIASGLALSNELNLRGTPTIVVNGWRYPLPPEPTELTRVIADLLAGRNPYPLAK